MGVKLGQLVEGEIHDLELLSRQRVVIDGSYVIVASLKKIRPNGRAFVNHWGEPLAPIHGIFYKTLRFLEAGIRPMYVFEGIPPSEKRPFDNRAKLHVQRLWKAYEDAKEVGDEKKVRNLFQNKSLIFRKANVDAIELLRTMGVPAIIAPSEGEAQGAALVRSNLADALFTPDYDALLFGCHTILRRVDFAKNQVEIVSLEVVLDSLGLTLHQLIDLAILIGTDFNQGIPRIGPKRGLTLIRKYTCIEAIPQITPPAHLHQIRQLFQTPTVTHFEPSALPPNVEMVQRLLIQKGFSHRRAYRARNRLLTAYRTHRTFQQPLVNEGGEFSEIT